MTFTFTTPREKAEVSDFAHFFEDGTKAKMTSEIKPPFKTGGLNSEIPITNPDREKSPNGKEKNEQVKKFSVNSFQLKPP